MTAMDSWQQRVVTEKKELDEKIAKLKAFTGMGAYSVLLPVDRELLDDQLRTMVEYSAILGRRIERFGSASDK